MTSKLKTPKLDQRLLKSVSRSFYLSIRLMPKVLRPAIGIAYLLARASDTIADTENALVTTRLRRLADFERLVVGDPSQHATANIQRDIQPTHPGEQKLIASLHDVLANLHARDAWEWKETTTLVAKIIRGQSSDLRLFNNPGTVTAIPTASALEEYTHFVAGCVGEWWTRMCFRILPGYSELPEDALTELGDSFGRGLQLVNILRDMPADLAAGRCYLPADELIANGVDPSQLGDIPMAAQPVFDSWEQRARELLDEGRQYIMSITNRRTRMACYLPWRLGVDTLDLFTKQPPLSEGKKVKVSRGAVRLALIRSIRVAFSNAPLA